MFALATPAMVEVEEGEEESDSADVSSLFAPATATPPALPPSVEEAYRRKCIQLKQRTAEVEEANDAARLRLARLKRQVEKMRLERAFLLEQLAKRTSTNVEDSDGSPSPPPTVSSPTASASFPPSNHPTTSSADHRHSSGNKLNNSSTSQPKEKPLRIKRGHRKPSMLNSFETPAGGASSTPGAAGASFLGSQNLQQTHSPSSDAFSAQPGEGKANGVRFFPPKKPGSAFELYCDEKRAEQRKEKEQESKEDEEDKEDKGDTEEGGTAEGEEDEQRLARDWKDLAESRREEFEARADDELVKYQKEKDAYDAKVATKKSSKEDADEEMDVDNERRGLSVSVKEAGETPQPQEDQEDVEMGNYDTDQETQGEKLEE